MKHLKKSTKKRHITFDKKTKRFRDSKGRFMKHSLAMRSSIARSQYHNYRVSYRPARRPYEKIREVLHKEARTKDFEIRIQGPPFTKGIEQAINRYKRYSITAQIRVTGKKKSTELNSISYSQFIDEFQENWSEILADLGSRIGQSGGRILSVDIIFKKFL